MSHEAKQKKSPIKTKNISIQDGLESATSMGFKKGLEIQPGRSMAPVGKVKVKEGGTEVAFAPTDEAAPGLSIQKNISDKILNIFL